MEKNVELNTNIWSIKTEIVLLVKHTPIICFIYKFFMNSKSILNHMYAKFDTSICHLKYVSVTIYNKVPLLHAALTNNEQYICYSISFYLS